MIIIKKLFGWVLSQNHSLYTLYKKNEDRKITLSNRGYRKIVSICYPESKIISDIGHMFGVASVIHIGVISHHISVSISLFRFGRVRIAVTIGNITKLVLGMILRSNNTLSRDMSFNRSGKGRDWSSRGLTNRICSFNDINVILVDFNNRW